MIQFLKMFRIYVTFMTFMVLSPLSFSAETITLYAAGSLKKALTDVTASYEKNYQVDVDTTFGPSGILRKNIEAGDNPDVFASANMAHPHKLALQKWGSPVVLFARNKLCALTQANINVTSENLLSKLLETDVRLGTSTPKADPSGDYAWELFKKSEAIKQGSFSRLSAKALQLTGGVNSELAPQNRNQYAWVMSENRADIFLTYCTNAVLAQKEVPTLKIIKVPEDLAVGADYGLVVREGTTDHAWRLAMYILSSEGQHILGKYGFEAVMLSE